MITFGKVFCKTTEPNCKACPMRGECQYFASAVASGTEKPQALADIEDIGGRNMSTSQGRTQVYELDDHDPLLAQFEKREEHGDSHPSLLAIRPPGGTNQRAVAVRKCISQETGKLCDEKTCLSCFVGGTILIPNRTALQSTFPLNGTYFQINEVFADHDSSLNPISIPRDKLRNLRKRNVVFGPSIFSMPNGLSTEAIQRCFVRGSICFRGFDRMTRGCKPLQETFYRPANKGKSHVNRKRKNKKAGKQIKLGVKR
uniref:Protein ROS1 n=1 Tax=Noccaea caerulescens TaxID=107243 RepID=A0A1J3DPH9_NOCCA